ncbi:restriction endonuclease subunit S [Methanobrevibacter smithii]|uniref:restriction endonuclease subunit S n=1 Tax=Methanobrevibacter smithii TaxID=2173 RepID=UPI0037DD0476
MSLNFETVSLGEHLYIKGRIGWKGLKKDEYLDQGNYRIINATALEEEGINWDDCGYISKERFEESPEIILKDKDILISKDGTIGKLGYVKNLEMDSTVASGIFVVRNQNEEYIDTDFLYYYFKSPFFKWFIKSVTEGSVIPHLYQRDFTDMEFNLFNLDTQKKCSSILNAIEEKINVNRKINKNLDDILDSIFKENFIKEFDNDNNDWKIKNIGELPLIITDYVANGSFASLKENVTILDYEEYAYFIRNTDLKSKSFQKFVNKHSYDFLKKSSLFGNEVIISNVGDVGSVFLCPFLDKPMTLGNNMILVKSRDDAINLNFYLFLLFRSNYGQYLISTITAGSVQSKFNKTEFKSLELTMPNDELIIKFNNLVSPIFDYKNKISDEIVRLTKLRDTLLPKLMSGEIDVSKINCDLE